ncbi:MAG TPA: DUF2911 domain-containing protein [Gemmatimonadaceae bacterium]|nr:DUF2911 domain-containing protein [Gemmatimonadaceae bacterium]
MTRRHLSWVAVASALSLPLATARGQVLASEHGVVAQTVNGTTITVEYYRPQARGRDPLFGKVVSWKETWTPGANWATTIDVDKDVQLEGRPLPKGTYSLWMEPQSSGPWTVILFTKAKQFHMHPPDKQYEQMRFIVQPESAPQLEILTFTFPDVRPDGATLRLHWGKTAVPMHFTVGGAATTVAANDRRALVGKYSVSWDDTTSKKAVFEVFESKDALRGRSNPLEGDYYDSEFDLVPAGNNRYHPGYYLKGRYYGVEQEESYVFQLTDGRVTGVEILGLQDEHLGHAVPVK